MEAKVLRDWSLGVDDSPSFTPPEQRSRRLAGTLPCGKKITTSPVRERVAEATYRTHSGSLYRLEGPPHSLYAQWCRDRGIEIDLKDPLKIIKPAEPTPTRLQLAIKGKSFSEAVDAVQELHDVIWKECAAKGPGPGSIYGEALKEAGFWIDPSVQDDRYNMAAFPGSASVVIAKRELAKAGGAA